MKPFITIFTLFSLLISISLVSPIPLYAVQAVTTAFEDEGFDETSTSCITFKSPSFKIGQRDTNTQGDVTLLQNYLISKGYLTGTAVGAYGTRTATAVRKFQKDKGISQTGNVGPRTKIAIQEDSCSSSHEDDEELSVTPTAPTAASTAPTCSNPKEYYYYHNVDVKNAGVDAITHWNEFGMKEGRRSCWTGAQSTATQSTGTAGGSNAVSGAVPQVTIKATTYGPTKKILLTWTATNNPNYCTGTDGTSSGGAVAGTMSSPGVVNPNLWATMKILPSTSNAYHQLVDLDSEDILNRGDSVGRWTFGITCTNAFGTSAVAKVTTVDHKALFAYNSAFRPHLAGEVLQIDPIEQVRMYQSRNAHTLFYLSPTTGKICKRTLTTNVLRDRVTPDIVGTDTVTPLCTQESDFVKAVDQKQWFWDFQGQVKTKGVFSFSLATRPVYNPVHPINDDITKLATFSTQTVSSGSGASLTMPAFTNNMVDVPIPTDVVNLDSAQPEKRDLLTDLVGKREGSPSLLVLRDSRYNINYMPLIGVPVPIGFGMEDGLEAWMQKPAAPPVTTLSAVQTAPNTVTLTWRSSNSTGQCAAYPTRGVLAWGGTQGIKKSVPTEGSTKRQVISVTDPGTYTFEMRCLNNYGPGNKASATVTVTGTKLQSSVGTPEVTIIKPAERSTLDFMADNTGFEFSGTSKNIATSGDNEITLRLEAIEGGPAYKKVKYQGKQEVEPVTALVKLDGSWSVNFTTLKYGPFVGGANLPVDTNFPIEFLTGQGFKLIVSHQGKDIASVPFNLTNWRTLDTYRGYTGW